MTEQAIQVEVENLSDIKRKLHIVVPKEEVHRQVNRAYRDLGKKVKVKGFRPGKAPRAVLELYYRQQVEREISELLVRHGLSEALKEKALEPLDLEWPNPMPQVTDGEDYRFTVELEITPELTVANYLGLTLEDPGVEVTEEEVDKRLEEIRQTNTILQPLATPRGVQEGDFVVLSYQGYFAGQPLAEAKADSTYLEVGAGKFNLDFEKQLLGLTPEAETRFAVDLPQDFFNPLLAGKTIEFLVTIHDIKEKQTPELNDAFAQSLSGDFQTLADLRTSVRQGIIKAKEKERQGRLEQQVLDKLLADHPMAAPSSLVRQEKYQMVREQMERLQQYGVNLAGMDTEKMMEKVQPSAERRVRARLLLDKVAAQENIVIDDAEVEASLAQLADKTNQSLAEVRKFYQDRQLLEPLRRQLRNEKTMKFILENATLTPKAAAGEENV